MSKLFIDDVEVPGVKSLDIRFGYIDPVRDGFEPIKVPLDTSYVEFRDKRLADVADRFGITIAVLGVVPGEEIPLHLRVLASLRFPPLLPAHNP